MFVKSWGTGSQSLGLSWKCLWCLNFFSFPELRAGCFGGTQRANVNFLSLRGSRDRGHVWGQGFMKSSKCCKVFICLTTAMFGNVCRTSERRCFGGAHTKKLAETRRCLLASFARQNCVNTLAGSALSSFMLDHSIEETCVDLNFFHLGLSPNWTDPRGGAVVEKPSKYLPWIETEAGLTSNLVICLSISFQVLLPAVCWHAGPQASHSVFVQRRAGFGIGFGRAGSLELQLLSFQLFSNVFSAMSSWSHGSWNINWGT